MNPRSSSAKKPAGQVLKDIRRATRRHFSAETAKSATNGGNLQAVLAGEVADSAGLAGAKPDLAPMARTASVMLLPCAAIYIGSKLWPRHNA